MKKIPQFSPYSGDPSLSKRSQYPYFWRSFGEASTTNAIVAFLRNYNFTRVAINYLASALQAYNISIVSQQTFTIANWDGSTAAKDLQYPLQMLKEAEARIIISIHQGYNGYLVLNEADRNGMVGPDYFWIFGSGIEDTSYGMFTHKELEEGFPGYPKTPRFPELTRGLMTLLRDDYDYLANEDFLKRYRPMVKDLIVRLNDTYV
ncbi:Metabotropic GABA-B receptor subtype 3A [Nowakowskiella sp. JEL0407]|nr:Metabotropic GABA-B receptor subtype 3A [Nowakowskiella sp. JEL0407]